MSTGKSSIPKEYRNQLENAKSYSEVWNIVKNSVKFSLHKHRRGMMLFLDDLPIYLGAYHSVGTNNIVLNRRLIQIVEATLKSKRVVNSLVYNLLLHEYLHALGENSETEARRLVYTVSKKCFGEEHVATVIAKSSPWVLLEGVPLEAVDAPRRFIEIVKDFEAADKYIV